MQKSDASSPPQGGEPVLLLNGVSKSFPGVRALNNVSFALRAGEVAALVGENGAGKSTIVKILTGIYSPDAGEIAVGGQLRKFQSPRDSWAAGIAAIHQETVMFDELSVAENIFMGHMPCQKSGLVDWPHMRQRTAELLKSIEADFDPEDKLKQLSVAQKHLVEIARALSHEASVIIMDEPTAALSRNEIDDLFRIIAQLKAAGRAVMFISHKFDEIFRVADSFVCLRDGEKVGDGKINGITEPKLVSMMVGRPIDQVFPKRDIAIGDVVLKVEGLSNPTEFADISFELRRGEILGFYGLVGAGRSEAMQCLFGMSAASSGRVLLNGTPLRIASPVDAIAAGISYVPEDRQEQGAVLPLTIRENITLASIASHVRNFFLSKSSELKAVRALGKRLDVRAAHWEQKLGELSGGNQQKVVIAKWLAARPKVIILDEPTKGIDVGSKAAVHDFIGELAEEGLAVILISSELPEIMGLADRVVVMQEGRIANVFTRGTWSAEAIVSAATGARKAA
ncbi:MAG: sugar ABC transporter ATP-binding protein [Aestuariivirga sp.]|nr:sugar ABC transporter ATP-binding protein [Aestuariivirga sp.]